jgi:CRISPR-associated endonuclease/helicase Cas3
MVQRATGVAPYPYQSRIAEEGLPELLKVPTGTGKTLAATLPWLYRRCFHTDLEVRVATPRWLVYVLPMRVLVDQTRDVIREWLTRLGLDSEMKVHVVMGGAGRAESLWREFPERDAIFVGTLDMLVSRALNRGYGATRFVWPIDFGLFNNGCQWVFDEVQLMGPALPTSRQLEGLRRKLGTALPCRSMWMSATVDERMMRTVDLPEVGESIELTGEDRGAGLGTRLEARKTIHELAPDPGSYEASLAASLAERHQPGTLSIAVLNTVKRAVDLSRKLAGITDAEVILVHSRFRPPERATQIDAALTPPEPGGPGKIVISTQVLEAGVDISATTLFTEAAPWPSVVQRAGRCNRDGKVPGAVLLWAKPPKPGPYLEADIEASAAELVGLEGTSITSEELGQRQVPTTAELHAVLRRRDLIELFDTTPDLSGNDIDVARFIRLGDDLDVEVAWREVADGGPDATEPLPGSDERCRVPVGEIRKLLKSKRPVWRHDHIDEQWVRLDGRDLRPGLVLILQAGQGGYDPGVGWAPASRAPVSVIQVPEDLPAAEGDVDAGGDPSTFSPRRWISLERHLADVEGAVKTLIDSLAPHGLSPDHLEAVAVAGRLHDIGKAHEAFQDMLEASAGSEKELQDGEAVGRPWAKSPGTKWVRNERRYFRHELASALALLSDGTLDNVPERDLVLYLVASHHGRVRLGLRSLPGERPPPGEPNRLVALGVWDGDELPEIGYPGGRLSPVSLDLSVMNLGDSADGRPSWSHRTLKLRDRADLGPFRLGLMEAMVRLADWRASADATERAEDVV